MSNNYTLGRGEVHFGQFKPETQQPRGERYLGNTPELGFSAEEETLDHYSSDRGVRIKDESVILQLDYAGSFITDNISPSNLAMFFLGESLDHTAASATGEEDTFEGVHKGMSYQLGTSDALPAGVRDVENVSVDMGGTSLTAGEDYVVEERLARITLLEGGDVTEDSDITVTYDVKASTRSRIISRADTIEGSMRFLAFNPAGDNIDYFMPWVKLTPNGDFQLKGDEWQQLPFNMEVLKKGSLESIYMDGRPFTP